MQSTIPIDITKMQAAIPEGIDVLWNGRHVNSGPLEIHLDGQARGEDDNRGELNYESNVASARFNLTIDVRGIAKLVASATQYASMQPLRAVVQSEGVITEDHNFGLSGPVHFAPHPLFGAAGVSAMILPGR